MKFLKIQITVSLDLVEQVEESMPTGSILEEMLADPESIKEVKTAWQQSLGKLGNVKDLSIIAADVVEI